MTVCPDTGFHVTDCPCEDCTVVLDLVELRRRRDNTVDPGMRAVQDRWIAKLEVDLADRGRLAPA